MDIIMHKVNAYGECYYIITQWLDKNQLSPQACTVSNIFEVVLTKCVELSLLARTNNMFISS